MRSRGRKIMRDIRSRKGRTLLVVLSILIGVFGVTTLVSLNSILVSQLEEDIDPDELAMTHIYMQAIGSPISNEQNADYIEQLTALPGVETVEGQAIYPINWKKPNEADFTEGQILAYSVPLDQVKMEPIAQVLEGRLPEPGQNELAVERRFEDAFGVGVGDKITFRQLPDVEWEVVGVVFHPYFTIALFNQGSIDPKYSIFTNYDQAQQIAQFTGLSSFYVRYTDTEVAKAGLGDLSEAISTQTPYIPSFSWVDDPDEAYILEIVEQVAGVLSLLAGVAMVVSGFLVTNVINSIVVEQKKQIGVMKSLGASRFDNFLMYSGMAIVYGLIGTVIGIILAVPLASWMAATLADEFDLTVIEGFRISPTGVIIGLVLGIFVPLVAACVPVYNGTRVSILDSMTDLGISSKWGTSRAARFIGRLPFPVTIRQALSNIFQKKGRLALTGLTLTMAVAAFMGVTAVFTSLGDTISSIYDTIGFEASFTPQTAQPYEATQAMLAQHPDVEGVYPGYSVSVEVEGYESADPLSEGSNLLNVTGIDPTTPTIEFDLVEGRGWQDDPNRRGVVISQGLADNIDKSLGDTLVVTVNGQSYEYEILGIDKFPFDLMVFEWQELARISGYVDENGQPLVGMYYLTFKNDNPTVDEVASANDEITDMLLANGVQGSFINQVEIEEETAASINAFSMIFNMTSGVMAAVGAVGLLAALSMAVFERQKEIGVMRSIGARSRTITGQFLTEGVLVGIIAWMAAVPLSMALGSALAGNLGFGDFNYAYPPQVMVLGLVGVVVVAIVASLWPSVMAARRTVSDILRYQ